MVTKKKSVKKSVKVSKPVKKNNSCNCNNYVQKGYGCVKIASMAFILFLITVWPAAMSLVHRIHWGWFLGVFVIFSAIAMKRICRNCNN